MGPPCVQARSGSHRPQHPGPVRGQRHHQLDRSLRVADLVPADAGDRGDLRRGARTGRVWPAVAPRRARDDHCARGMLPNGPGGQTVGNEDGIGPGEQSGQQRRGHRSCRRSQNAGQRRRRPRDAGWERGPFPFDVFGHHRALVPAHGLETRVAAIGITFRGFHLDHVGALVGQEARRVRPGDARRHLHHPHAFEAARRCPAVSGRHSCAHQRDCRGTAREPARRTAHDASELMWAVRRAAHRSPVTAA